MASSYDKIHESLMKTEAWKTLNESFCEQVPLAKIEGYSFRYNPYSREDDDRLKVLPSFKVRSFGRETNHELFVVTKFEFGDAVKMLPADLNRVVELEFATPSCPTYNCKKDKLLEGSKKIDGWSVVAYKKLIENNHHLVLDNQDRIREQFEAILKSDEFIRDKERFYETVVIKEIRDVVLKYYDKVGPDVLKEALDQVVTHFITES